MSRTPPSYVVGLPQAVGDGVHGCRRSGMLRRDCRRSAVRNTVNAAAPQHVIGHRKPCSTDAYTAAVADGYT